MIQTFKTKPVAHAAIQFDGKNGRELKEWVETTETSLEHSIRNGGSWANLNTFFEDGSQAAKETIRKGDFLVLYPEGYFGIEDREVFVHRFTIPKNAVLI